MSVKRDVSTLPSGARIIGRFKNAPAPNKAAVQAALKQAARYIQDEQLAYDLNRQECEKRGLKP